MEGETLSARTSCAASTRSPGCASRTSCTSQTLWPCSSGRTLRTRWSSESRGARCCFDLVRKQIHYVQACGPVGRVDAAEHLAGRGIRGARIRALPTHVCANRHIVACFGWPVENAWYLTGPRDLRDSNLTAIPPADPHRLYVLDRKLVRRRRRVMRATA